jgi:hypothetical protein
MKKQVFVLAMSVIVLVLGTTPVRAWSYNLEEFTITTNDVYPLSVSNNGSYVVWKGMNAPIKLYGYDLSAKQEFIISPNDVPWNSINLSPDSNYVVWKDSSVPLQFCGYDLAARGGFVICPNDMREESIAISGNYVVWKNQSPDTNLYGYNLSTKERFVVCPNDVDTQTISSNDNYAVWTYSHKFYGYDLLTREAFIICPNEVFWTSINLSPDSNYVVWKDSSVPLQFCGYDLAARGGFVICPNDMREESIAISGNYVVWKSQSPDSKLYGFNLSTKEKFVICPDDVDTQSISSNDNYAVWTYSHKFYGYDLSAREEFIISPNDVVDWTSINLSPDSNYVVWENSPAPYQFCGYDLATRGGFIISPNDVEPMSIAISGSYVVWKDTTGDVDFYGARIYSIINDECIDAVDVEVVENVPYSGSTVGATGNDISSCAYNDTIDVWHLYKPNAGGQVTITTDGSDFDTTLSVYNACGGTEIDCNDDYCDDNLQSKVALNVVKGKKYHIRVSGFDGETGDYQLLVTRGACVEPIKSDLNDDCAVDMLDFAILASQWLTCNLEP